jgi:hypothetical protein
MDEDPLLFTYSPSRISEIFSIVSENAGQTIVQTIVSRTCKILQDKYYQSLVPKHTVL